MNFTKLKSPAILAVALAFGACPVLAQTTTQEQQTTTTTTTTDSGPHRHESAHQLKKDQKAAKAQAEADEAKRKLVKSDKMHDAKKKQAQADDAADRADNPNR